MEPNLKTCLDKQTYWDIKKEIEKTIEELQNLKLHCDLDKECALPHGISYWHKEYCHLIEKLLGVQK